MAVDPVHDGTHGAAAASGLSVTAEEREDLVLVALEGPLDAYTTPGFREEVRRYDPAETRLVIDLTGVGLLDSAGLSALLSLRNEAHRGGAQLGLICPQRALARLFWLTGLRAAFVFGHDLAAVRAALDEEPTAPRLAATPRPASCGLLLIQGAILTDAATEVAGIERQMAAAQSDARLLDHRLAALRVLDRTTRLLEGQRAALLDQLGERAAVGP
jgi:anti-anti-sigma factor